jgi:GNAT superfamily N-acetyltransferase
VLRQHDGVDLVTLADRPDLAESTFAIPYGPDASAFMQGNMAALLTRRRRLSQRWAEYIVAVLDEHGTPLARGVSVPFAADPGERELYPAGGWDQIAIWAAEDALDGAAVDTVCALEVAVHPDHRQRGLSGITVGALKDNTRAHRIEAADPDEYDATVRRNVREQDTDARPLIANPIPAIDRYDTVLLASPIWNVRAPMIMTTFTEALDFTGKTVYPVVTYAVSGLGTTVRDYAASCRGATLREGLAVRGEEVQDAEPAVESWLRRNRLLD